jgi:diacylglycerol kinase family enzyme
MAQRTAILLNPRAGAGLREPQIERALESAGVEAKIHHVPAHASLTSWLTEVGSDYDILVAAGGDGTVSAVAATTVRLHKTLGIIPGGTLNHFARDLGIPNDVPNAVATLAAGSCRHVDVGAVNGIVFINNTSIGAYPRMVWQRDRTRQKGWPRGLAAVAATVRTWLDLQLLTVRLCIDDTELIRRSPFLFVGNSWYEVEGLQFGRRPRLTDGTLSFYVAPEAGRFAALMLPLRSLLGSLRADDKFEAWRASSISMHFATRQLRVALDGEVQTLTTPLRFSIESGALRAIVPTPVEPRQ